MTIPQPFSPNSSIWAAPFSITRRSKRLSSSGTPIFRLTLKWIPKSQNSIASVAKTDFTTAFARLLRDGPLRDAYARDPHSALDALDLDPSERAALVTIGPQDLELQAEVFLRKRFESLSRL